MGQHFASKRNRNYFLYSQGR